MAATHPSEKIFIFAVVFIELAALVSAGYKDKMNCKQSFKLILLQNLFPSEIKWF